VAEITRDAVPKMVCLLSRQPFGKLRQVAAKNPGNPAHLFQRWIPLSPLHSTHVAAVNLRLEGKALLRKPFFLAGLANSLPECLERRVLFQHLTVLATEDLSSTDYNPHFVLALGAGICQKRSNENAVQQSRAGIQEE